MKNLVKVLLIIWSMIGAFTIGIIIGVSVKIESPRECIDIPEDKLIVITRGEMLLETLQEK